MDNNIISIRQKALHIGNVYLDIITRKLNNLNEIPIGNEGHLNENIIPNQFIEELFDQYNINIYEYVDFIRPFKQFNGNQIGVIQFIIEYDLLGHLRYVFGQIKRSYVMNLISDDEFILFTDQLNHAMNKLDENAMNRNQNYIQEMKNFIYATLLSSFKNDIEFPIQNKITNFFYILGVRHFNLFTEMMNLLIENYDDDLFSLSQRYITDKIAKQIIKLMNYFVETYNNEHLMPHLELMKAIYMQKYFNDRDNNETYNPTFFIENIQKLILKNDPASLEVYTSIVHVFNMKDVDQIKFCISERGNLDFFLPLYNDFVTITEEEEQEFDEDELLEVTNSIKKFQRDCLYLAFLDVRKKIIEYLIFEQGVIMTDSQKTELLINLAIKNQKDAVKLLILMGAKLNFSSKYSPKLLKKACNNLSSFCTVFEEDILIKLLENTENSTRITRSSQKYVDIIQDKIFSIIVTENQLREAKQRVPWSHVQSFLE